MAKSIICYDRDDAIATMKMCIAKIVPSIENRKWLVASPPDSYENKDYHYEFWVLEGSPAKAISIIDDFKKTISLIPYPSCEKNPKLLFIWGVKSYNEYAGKTQTHKFKLCLRGII